MRIRHALLAFAAGACAVGQASAEEGMWTFNRFPAEQVQKAYGFKPDQKWLDGVRQASVRLAQGCSGSFVSPQGLVMTNHHCVHECVEQLSTPKKDLVEGGFWAKTQKDETTCPDLEVNNLVAITDVTARVQKAMEGKSDQAANEARKAEMSKIEKECATGDDVRCDVVSLYNGGIYDLYKYRRYQDVRLVFAPELGIAFFGGDPDNFMFPRFTLDAAFLRVYENGAPAKIEHYFPWSPAGTKEGELTFVSGHPGSTSRLQTVAEIESWRDFGLVPRLLYLAEIRGALTEYAKRGKEQERHSKGMLFGVENALKAFRGEAHALFQPGLMAQKRAQEKTLRDRVMGDKAMATQYGGAWEAVAKAQALWRQYQKRYTMLESRRGFSSDLYDQARTLVRASAELAKPNEQRLREYNDANLPALKQGLFSAAPIYDEFEIFRLSWSLTKLREALGPDDPFVKQVLGKESPEQLAVRVVKGSKLKDPKVRRQLFEGGAAAIEASRDPMIQLAKLVDPEARAIRKKMEDEVEAPVKRAHEQIAKARFAVEGTNSYPDATFTLRLSYGSVKGWEEEGKPVPPYTTFAGAYERHTGAEPFALPKSWLDAKSKVDLATPMNFVTTNDIIGGNSGSPVINRDAQIVGLIFDGNIHSLGGDYGFDAKLNRSVAVDSRAIAHALEKVYGADRLAQELRGGK